MPSGMDVSPGLREEIMVNMMKLGSIVHKVGVFSLTDIDNTNPLHFGLANLLC
jgi:hypothetical protein